MQAKRITITTRREEWVRDYFDEDSKPTLVTREDYSYREFNPSRWEKEYCNAIKLHDCFQHNAEIPLREVGFELMLKECRKAD